VGRHNADNPVLNFVHCPTHGKRAYPDRQTARNAIRRHGDSRMRAYRCDALHDVWHIGHLPAAVKRGHVTTREIYGSTS
jgi:hypothetical protein